MKEGFSCYFRKNQENTNWIKATEIGSFTERSKEILSNQTNVFWSSLKLN